MESDYRSWNEISSPLKAFGAAHCSFAGLLSSFGADMSDAALDIILGNDTRTSTAPQQLDGRILEKPVDDDDAFSMLSSLSGQRHLVHSGVSIFTSAVGKEEAAVTFCETTEVVFTSLSPEEIGAYIR